MLAMLVVASGR